jgi:hypothetical protein
VEASGMVMTIPVILRVLRLAQHYSYDNSSAIDSKSLPQLRRPEANMNGVVEEDERGRR